MRESRHLFNVMIRFEQLRKEYDDLVAVNDLDLGINEGEIFGLIGPNGAGKTTTIRMACGLVAPTAGRVSVAGLDVQKKPERAQEFIGYLADVFSVYEDLTVWEYLDYFAHAYKMPEEGIPSRINEVIAEVGLEVKRDAMILGLSRGMKQRLGIARAVIHRPRVLVLDEPASGLDPKARLDLRNLLLSLQDQGTTILISSHILSELEGFCTSIGLMEQGRMTESGSIDTIAAATQSHRVVRLRWTEDSPAPDEVLEQDSEVSSPVVQGLECVFRFNGPDQALASLLTRLVGSGVQIVFFGEEKQTVEDIYMKISKHGAS